MGDCGSETSNETTLHISDCDDGDYDDDHDDYEEEEIQNDSTADDNQHPHKYTEATMNEHDAMKIKFSKKDPIQNEGQDGELRIINLYYLAEDVATVSDHTMGCHSYIVARCEHYS